MDNLNSFYGLISYLNDNKAYFDIIPKCYEIDTYKMLEIKMLIYNQKKSIFFS